MKKGYRNTVVEGLEGQAKIARKAYDDAVKKTHSDYIKALDSAKEMMNSAMAYDVPVGNAKGASKKTVVERAGDKSPIKSAAVQKYEQVSLPKPEMVTMIDILERMAELGRELQKLAPKK